MKRKVIVGAMLVALLAVQTVFSFGAPSTNTGMSNSPSTSQTTESKEVVSVGTTGVKSTETLTTTTSTGQVGAAVVVDVVTPTGKTVTVNENGDAVIGDRAIGFAKGRAETAGLAEKAVQDINAINSGADLSTFIKPFDLRTHNAVGASGKIENLGAAPMTDLTGFHALMETQAIVTKNAKTGLVEDVQSEVVLYIPNLIAGLQNVTVLFYDNSTGRWIILQPTAIDPVTKTIAVNVTGSGTMTVIHKK